MASVSITNEALGRAFTTALLLTGSADKAEAAVLEGIRVMEQRNISGEALLQGTMAASIATKLPKPRVEEQAYAEFLLPVELRRVLRLSQELRRCFVLRVLAGLSREVCARMLHTETTEIDEFVCVSARALACLAEEERSRWKCEAAISGRESSSAFRI